MTVFGFGQKTGQIMQMAYVVEDIQAAMNMWLMDTDTGPWFLLESFTGPDQRYRGEQSLADVSIAMAFNGHMNIELIQPKDDHPSLYKEIIERRGYGFHHVGIAVEDVEAEKAKYESRGFITAFQADVGDGDTVYYMDDGRNEPGFIELIPGTSTTDKTFTRFWLASVDWDGKDPIRTF